MKCQECNWNYPQWMLSTMRTNDTNADGKEVCGICALRISNEIHRVNRTKFNGRSADYMRLNAIKWRENNPEAKP